jgi:hypothetical protein
MRATQAVFALKIACMVGLVLSVASIAASGFAHHVERTAKDAFVESKRRALQRVAAFEAPTRCVCAQTSIQARDRAIASLSSIGFEASARNVRHYKLVFGSSMALVVVFLSCLLLLRRVDSFLRECGDSAHSES